MTARNFDIVYSEDYDLLVDHVFERMERRLEFQPDQRAFLIVPEPMKADMERHFITRTHVGGIMLTEILSFRRLATRLFSESGIPMPDPVSNAGKAILAQKILLDQEIPFKTFKRMAGQPRYAAELVRILGDFQRYEISSDELFQIESKNQATLDKLHDFALLKNALEGEIADRRLGDPDCTLTNLASLLLSSPLPQRLAFLGKTHIWVVGFGADRQFTSQEMKVLRGLASRVSGMTFTVTADYPGGNRGALAFQHGRATIDTLKRILPGIQIAQAASQPVEKTTKYPQGNDVKATTDVKRDVQLIEAINVHEEARYCAGKIRELLLEGQFRRRDIGIALCDKPSMPNIIETTLAEYGVDSWVDTRKPLSQSSFARTFTAFLSLCSYDFSFDQLMDYYRNGLSPLSDNVIDSFENAALALGWTTARDFRELATSPALLNDELSNRFRGNDYERNAVRTALKDVFHLLTVTSEMRGLRNGYDKSELLLDYLFSGQRSSPADRVMQRTDTLIEQKRQDSATLLVSSWNATVDLLRECRELLGKTRISQDHYTQLLLAGLEGLVLPAVPLGADHVRVGSLKAMATWPCRVLFILGATATAFPPENKQQGYLRDEERELLSEKTKKPFPNLQKDDPASQAWLVHMLLSRPTHSLYVSVPSIGEDGQSYVFDNLKVKPSKEGEGLKDQKPNNLSTVVEPGRIPDVRWNALQAAQRIMRWNAKAPPTWRAAVDQEGKAERPLLELADKIADHTMLPPELSSSIFLSGNGVSISLLQKYNKCPFLYFAEHVACAKERVKAEDKSNLQGTLLHSLVELATTDLIDRLQHADTPEKISEITTLWRSDVESTDYIRKLYNTATSNPSLRWYALPSSSGSIGERLRFFASKALHALAEFSQEDGYSPRLLEWYFPHSDSEPYVLHVDTLRFTLRGLIDLIEENPAGKVRIIDFKRTSKVFSWLDLSDGTDIQLPLYKLAFETAFPEKKVDELYFCGFEELDTKVADVYDNAAVDKNEIRKKLESQKRRWEPGDVDGAAQFAEKKAMETIRHILTGAFPARPTIRHADFSPCHYCNWRAACGYDLRLARNAPLPRETNTDKKKEILMEITGETEI